MAGKKHRSLKQESLAENKELGLDDQQAMFDLIFATLREYGIDERLWLEEYFAASGVGNGLESAKAPADVEQFLPWNMPAEMRQRLQKRTILHL